MVKLHTVNVKMKNAMNKFAILMLHLKQVLPHFPCFNYIFHEPKSHKLKNVDNLFFNFMSILLVNLKKGM